MLLTEHETYQVYAKQLGMDYLHIGFAHYLSIDQIKRTHLRMRVRDLDLDYRCNVCHDFDCVCIHSRQIICQATYQCRKCSSTRQACSCYYSQPLQTIEMVRSLRKKHNESKTPISASVVLADYGNRGNSRYFNFQIFTWIELSLCCLIQFSSFHYCRLKELFILLGVSTSNFKAKIKYNYKTTLEPSG